MQLWASSLVEQREEHFQISIHHSFTILVFIYLMNLFI